MLAVNLTKSNINKKEVKNMTPNQNYFDIVHGRKNLPFPDSKTLEILEEKRKKRKKYKIKVIRHKNGGIEIIRTTPGQEDVLE